MNAAHRSIPFLLTFSEWLRIWQDSGHWDERGYCRGQYVMARHGDAGAYEVGNVRICTATENNKEKTLSTEHIEKLRRLNRGNKVWLGRKHTAETRAKMRKAQLGKPKSDETKAKISAAKKGKKVPKLSAALKGKPPWNKGIPMSAEQKEKLRQANLGKKLSAAQIAALRAGHQRFYQLKRIGG